MARGTSITNSNWKKVFDTFSLLQGISDDGFVDITSDQFHSLHLQPRLLTKMDHAHQVPEIFQDNGLNILTRGLTTWRIGKFEVFKSLPDWKTPEEGEAKNLEMPPFIQSIDTSKITGEPGVIHAAQASGMLTDFLEENQTLTISGRMRTHDFSFEVNNKKSGQSIIDVSGAQIEIDAGFESKSAISLFEIKNHIAGDLCIRQLYFPMRVWQHRVPKKPIRNIFLTRANDVFDVYEFTFTNESSYSSAELIRHKRYTIGAQRPSVVEIEQTIQRSPVQYSKRSPVSPIPFPQADDFERVIDLVSFIAEKPRTTDDLTDNYDFHERQSSYYFDAARYLGLAETTKNELGQEFRIATNAAFEILSMPFKAKVLRFVELLVAIEPVRMTYIEWRKSGISPGPEWIERTLAASTLAVKANGEQLGTQTIKRRAKTVAAWAGWIIAMSEEGQKA